MSARCLAGSRTAPGSRRRQRHRGHLGRDFSIRPPRRRPHDRSGVDRDHVAAACGPGHLRVSGWRPQLSVVQCAGALYLVAHGRRALRPALRRDHRPQEGPRSLRRRVSRCPQVFGPPVGGKYPRFSGTFIEPRPSVAQHPAWHTERRNGLPNIRALRSCGIARAAAARSRRDPASGETTPCP